MPAWVTAGAEVLGGRYAAAIASGMEALKGRDATRLGAPHDSPAGYPGDALATINIFVYSLKRSADSPPYFICLCAHPKQLPADEDHPLHPKKLKESTHARRKN